MPRTHSTMYSSRRRGSMYVAVIGCSLVVTVVGVSALMAARVERRAAEGSSDFSDARFAAQSAVELGMYLVTSDVNWRTARPNGLWRDKLPFGDGTYSLSVVDPVDALLSNSKSEPIVLTGTGVVRNARYMLQATAKAYETPLKALNTCLHSGGNVTVSLLNSITLSGAPLSMNGSINGPGTITGTVEAGSMGLLPVIVGTTSIPATAKALPDASVFDMYVGLATSLGARSDISNVVLAPGVNPFGAINADGVYYVDATGTDLTIRSARINGTLVVLCGAGRKVTLDDDVFIHSFRADYPALIVKGALEIRLNSGSYGLREADRRVNYNPVGAPYLGVADADQTDTYPNEVRGLIHVTGNVSLAQSSTLTGVVIAEGNTSVSGNVRIIHDPKLYTNWPMGYVTYQMQISPGTWQRVVGP